MCQLLMFDSATPAQTNTTRVWRLMIVLWLPFVALSGQVDAQQEAANSAPRSDWLGNVTAFTFMLYPPRIFELPPSAKLSAPYFQAKLNAAVGRNQIAQKWRQDTDSCQRQISESCVRGYLTEIYLEKLVEEMAETLAIRARFVTLPDFATAVPESRIEQIRSKYSVIEGRALEAVRAASLFSPEALQATKEAAVEEAMAFLTFMITINYETEEPLILVHDPAEVRPFQTSEVARSMDASLQASANTAGRLLETGRRVCPRTTARTKQLCESLFLRQLLDETAPLVVPSWRTDESLNEKNMQQLLDLAADEPLPPEIPAMPSAAETVRLFRSRVWLTAQSLYIGVAADDPTFHEWWRALASFPTSAPGNPLFSRSEYFPRPRTQEVPESLVNVVQRLVSRLREAVPSERAALLTGLTVEVTPRPTDDRPVATATQRDILPERTESERALRELVGVPMEYRDRWFDGEWSRRMRGLSRLETELSPGGAVITVSPSVIRANFLQCTTNATMLIPGANPRLVETNLDFSHLVIFLHLHAKVLATRLLGGSLTPEEIDILKLSPLNAARIEPNTKREESVTARDLEKLLLVLDAYMAKPHEYMQLPIDCATRVLGFGLAHELAHAFLGTSSSLEPDEALADCFGLLLANSLERTVDRPLEKIINGPLLHWNTTQPEAESAVRKRQSALIGHADRLKKSSASYRGRPFSEWMQFCTQH